MFYGIELKEMMYDITENKNITDDDGTIWMHQNRGGRSCRKFVCNRITRFNESNEEFSTYFINYRLFDKYSEHVFATGCNFLLFGVGTLTHWPYYHDAANVCDFRF